MPSDQTCILEFHPKAAKEFNSLDNTQKVQILDKVEERLKNPFVQKDALRGDFAGFYKFKIHNLRIIYRVETTEKETVLVLLVVFIGKRDNDTIYKR